MKNYQYLNLEQKMAKIRKKMPSLLKKFHNDEADYDFATLDDIYESMTPALNKYGVNFDLVGESPTQYDKKRRLVYLTQDQDGFWRYESDLEICWTNIDHPKEERRVLIHIIGTHEIPDKARGTALTYGLKYYFRNKFCMRQIDSVQEDPDGMEYPAQERRTKPEDRASKEGKGKTPESGKNNPQKQAGKGIKKNGESKGSRLSGNDCPGLEDAAKAKKNDLEANGTKMPANESLGSTGKTTGSGSRQSCTDPQNQVGKEQKKSTDVSGNLTAKKDLERLQEQKSANKESAAPQTADGKEPAVSQAARRKGAEMPQTAEHQDVEVPQKAGQKEAGKPQEAAAKQDEDTGDGFQAVQGDGVPFEDASFMDELEKGPGEETKDGSPTLEAAKNVICPFGIYAGKPLGDVLHSGIKGREIVKWIAYRYQGPASEIVNAARLLLENPDEEMEQQAA